MPRIPLSEGQQLQPMRHDAVHAPMSIAGDFGMDDARALIGAGDRIRNAGEKIAGAGLAFASALVEQENRLAAAEDRNLLERYHQELNAKLASNPNVTDEEKQGWIADRARQYDDERRQFVDRMSSGFRKQHDAEIAGIRIRYQGEQTRILAAGRAQRVYDHYKELLKAAGLRGDLVEYQRLLGEAQGGETKVFSDEEAELLNRNYQHLADFGAARDAVDANTPDIDKMLVEKDDKGNYKYFANLTMQEREQLRRTAIVKRHEAETEEDNAYIAGLNDGSITDTFEDLKAAHDRKEISDAQFLRRTPWVRAVEKKRGDEANSEWVRAVESGEIETSPEQLQREFELGIISGTQRDLRIDYLKKREAASEKARNARQEQLRQEREREERRQRDQVQQQRKDKILAFCGRIDFTEWSSDPAVNVGQQNDLEKELVSEFSDDLEAQDKVRKHLQQSAREGMAGKGVFDTGEGKIVLKFIKDQYRKADGSYRGLKWAPWGRDKENSQEFMRARYFEIMDYAKDRLLQGDDATKVIEGVKARVAQLNDGVIRQIFARAARRKQPESSDGGNAIGTSSHPDGATGSYNGKKTISRGGKWYYAE